MPFTGYPGATLNVVGGFNEYFRTQLTAQGLPAWLPSAVINWDFPVAPLTFPSWSVTHLEPLPREVAQGRNLDPGFRGAEQIGLADIRAWVSVAQASCQAPLYLRVMRDRAARVFATGATVPILDVYGTTGTPTANGTIARARPARGGALGPGPHPGIRAARMIVEYRWLERVGI